APVRRSSMRSARRSAEAAGGAQRPRGAHPPHRGVEVELGIAYYPGPARPETLGGFQQLAVGRRSDHDSLLPVHGEITAGGAEWISRQPLEKRPQVPRLDRLTARRPDHDAPSLTDAVPGFGGGDARDLV